MRVGVGAREYDEVVAVEAAGLGGAVAHRGALPPPVLPRAVQKAAARRVQPMIVADYVAGAETGSVVGELEHSGPPGAVEGQWALTPDAAGVAYIEARPEGEEGVSYVLDPIEMSRVWGDEARARELLAALNGLGAPRSS